jgi:CheY-like chemotaxis protein
VRSALTMVFTVLLAMLPSWCNFFGAPMSLFYISVGGAETCLMMALSGDHSLALVSIGMFAIIEMTPVDDGEDLHAPPERQFHPARWRLQLLFNWCLGDRVNLSLAVLAQLTQYVMAAVFLVVIWWSWALRTSWAGMIAFVSTLAPLGICYGTLLGSFLIDEAYMWGVSWCNDIARALSLCCQSQERDQDSMITWRQGPRLVRWLSVHSIVWAFVWVNTSIIEQAGRHVSSCPAFASDLSLPLPSAPWPAGCDSHECKENIRASADVLIQMIWTTSISMAAIGSFLLLVIQNRISNERDKTSLGDALKMQALLRYISHEARSPLGAAILSLDLLTGTSVVKDIPETKAIISELHLSLEASTRHLDDLLVFDDGNTVSQSKRGWYNVRCAELQRLQTSFSRACGGQGIHMREDPPTMQMSLFNALMRSPLALGGGSRPLANGARSRRGSEPRTKMSRQQSERVPVRRSSVGGESPDSTARGIGSPGGGGGRAMSAELEDDVSGSVDFRRLETCPDRLEMFVAVYDVVALLQNALSNCVKHVKGDGVGRIRTSMSFLSWKNFAPKTGPAFPTSETKRPRSSDTIQSESDLVDVLEGLRWPSIEASSPHRSPSGTSPPPGRGGVSRHLSPGASMGGVSGGWKRSILQLQVLDNGSGINDALLRPGQLFRPFQMLRAGDGSLRMTSSGLGLSIVKNIAVERMHGVVGLSSREGEGTLFFAFIPVLLRMGEKPAPLLAPPTTTAKTPKGGGSRSQTSSSVGSSSGGGKVVGNAVIDTEVVERGSLVDVTAAHATDSKQSVGMPVSRRAVGRAVRDGADLTEVASKSVGSGVVVLGSGAFRSTGSDSGDSCHVDAAVVGGRGGSVASKASDVGGRGGRGDRHAREARREEEGVTDVDAAVDSKASDVGGRGGRGDRHAREARREARRKERETKRRQAASSSRAKGVGEGVESMGLALVVDDERVNRSLMARLLSSWGFSVQEMRDGRELVNWIDGVVRGSRARPTLITLDLQMPVLDGWGALREMRETSSSLRDSGQPKLARMLDSLVVIGVTGNAVRGDAERMKELGASEVLTKPTGPTELATAVEACCKVRLPERAHKRIGM